MNRVRLVTLIALLALLFGSLSPLQVTSAASWSSKVDPWVLDTAAQGETEFLVFLSQQADLSGAEKLATKPEKGQYVVERLRAVASRTQPAVIAQLQALGLAYQPFYIANMIWVRGDLSAIESLARRSDVDHLYANPTVHMDFPTQTEAIPLSPELPDTIEWNITKVNAPQVWAAGYNGQGAVVGGQDTGYDWDHPALMEHYRGWRDGLVSHNYNWHDSIHSGGGVCGANSAVPCDDSQHGTHTMGTMVGDDPSHTNQIGMAPGAQWIGCRNMDQGNGTPTTYSECYEWFIAPYPVGGTPAQGDPTKAPDVINNSWGCPPSEGCTNPNVMLAIVNAVRAAGIVTVHSAGNSGPNCSTVSDPAAIYDASFSVGATNSTDGLASFSSRGPVTIDGSGRRKPDISAPGVSIRSSVPGTGYAGGWSGTSMAGPHVAGMVALLISQEPYLAGYVSQIESIITQTAVTAVTVSPAQTCGGIPSSQIPNNSFGYGRINAWAAYQLNRHQLSLSKTASAPSVEPGGVLTYTLSSTHSHLIAPTQNMVIEDQIPAGTTFVSASPGYSLVGNTVSWMFASVAAGETKTVQLAVQVNLTGGSVVNSTYNVRSDDVAQFNGNPVSTPVIQLFGLELSKTAPAAVNPGETLTYTLAVTNTHPSLAAHNITLSDPLPTGTTFVGATLPYSLTGSTVTWSFASLAAGASHSVQLAVQVGAGTTGAVVNADYSATSAEVPQPVVGPPVVTLISQAAGVALSPGDEQWVRPGKVITYTHTLVNTGSGVDTFNLEVTSTQGWASLSGPGQVTLAAGQSATITVVVIVPADAAPGSQDTASLTATSVANAAVTASVQDRTNTAYTISVPLLYRIN